MQYVGQIIFALCIVIGQGSENVEHLRTFHAVDAGVDFLDSLLLLGSVLLLYDALNVAFSVADDAAIAKRIVHDCGQYGSSSAACLMRFAELFELLAVEQRSVAAKNQSGAGEALESLGGLHNSMAGAELLSLQSDGALLANHCFDHLSLMADDDNLFVCACDGSCVDDVLQHRLAAYLMQNLGIFAAHSGAFACGKDDGY